MADEVYGILKDKLYLPRYVLKGKMDLVRQHFEQKLYQESNCAKCPLLEYRHSTECDTCASYLGETKIWGKKTIKGERYVALPPCSMDTTKHLLDLPDARLKDLRSNEKFTHKIKFTGSLREGEIIDGVKTANQRQIVAQFLKHKSGIIQLSPRAGKTVLATYIICELGVKALVLADQMEFLKQFYETIAGGGKRRQAMTSVAQERDKDKFVRLVEKPEDLIDIQNVDIVLCNYQKFIRSPEAMKRLTEALGNRSFVVIDEVDSAAATQFSRVIFNLKARYRLGLSATVIRKDGRSWVLQYGVGRIVVNVENQGLLPEILLQETKINFPYQYKSWVGAMKGLANSTKRQSMILDLLKQDFKAGYNSVIIPVDFLKQAAVLQDLINVKFGYGTAQVFNRNSNRDKMLSDFDGGKFKVLIAIRRMIKRGVDLGRPNAIYIVVPMSAVQGVGAPMFYQLSHRVSTAQKGKKQPIVRLFVDPLPQSTGCFRSLFWYEILPHSDGGKARYVVSDAVKKEAKRIIDTSLHKRQKPDVVRKFSF